MHRHYINNSRHVNQIRRTAQSWALAVFLKLFLEGTYFFITYSPWPISVPVLFKKPTPSHIYLIENAKNIIFHYWTKLKNKCPALGHSEVRTLYALLSLARTFCIGGSNEHTRDKLYFQVFKLSNRPLNFPWKRQLKIKQSDTDLSIVNGKLA